MSWQLEEGSRLQCTEMEEDADRGKETNFVEKLKILKAQD